jgi:hemolysin-activating ACP:hemolysin acyltransferase
MKLVMIFGDAAVGKMTVGQELMKMTNLRLFHNHMTIEMVIDVFGYYDANVVAKLREVMFESFAESQNEGLIFTYMWAFDQQSDWDYVNHVSEIFKKQGAELYYVELIAPLEIRLVRNATENRLKHKPSKRDLEASNQRVMHASTNYRIVSRDGEIPFENYIKIDNSYLSPKACAKMIAKRFNFEKESHDTV